jgi:uncharacterized protein YqgC (DUF456 family)
MIDYILVILGGILMILGILGCILPVLPGPPISYVGLLLLHFTRFAQFTYTFLLIWACVTIFVTVLDYVVPIWGTKKFGGSKSGMWGAGIGLVIGIFFLPPIGIIVGPFAGAVIGEALTGKNAAHSFRAGFGSFLGLLAGVGMKLAASIIMTYYFIKELIITH